MNGKDESKKSMKMETGIIEDINDTKRWSLKTLMKLISI